MSLNLGLTIGNLGGMLRNAVNFYLELREKKFLLHFVKVFMGHFKSEKTIMLYFIKYQSKKQYPQNPQVVKHKPPFATQR